MNDTQHTYDVIYRLGTGGSGGHGGVTDDQLYREIAHAKSLVDKAGSLGGVDVKIYRQAPGWAGYSLCRRLVKNQTWHEATVYPEHEALRVISDQSQAIGEFLDWLNQAGPDKAFPGRDYGAVLLAFYPRREDNSRSHNLTPMRPNVQELLAAYYGIDQAKLEAEKQQMLARARAARPDPEENP